ncbi:MAG: type II secretion system protein [Candidatus Paceibacterota bacterium]
MSKRQSRYGFTLVELLIVMAIIGVLAAMVILSQKGSHAKARDAIRVKDFDEFATALYLYYDSYGVYPCGDYVNVTDTGKVVQTDSSYSCPFLQGVDGNMPDQNIKDGGGEPTRKICDLYHGGNYKLDAPIGPNGYQGCTAPLFGIQGGSRGQVIYNNIWKQDPLQDEFAHMYMYTVSEDRKSYVLQTTLEVNDKAMVDDGGMCNKRYEVGPGKGDASLTTPGFFNPGTFGTGESCN